jgi:hypothetical protein
MRTVLLGLVTPLALAAQVTLGNYSLSGTVVNSVTGAPVKGAEVNLVTLSNVDAGPGAPPNQPGPMLAEASSGAGGEYLFSGLAAGQYSLQASKSGFVTDSAVSGYPETIALSASVSGHTIRLVPLGVLEGTVSSQYGEPLAGVFIGLFEHGVVDGVRSVLPGRSAMTNDRGQFRIWDLQPGTYYVQARRLAGSTSLAVGDRSVHYTPWEGFRPVYFGGAHGVDSATPVTVAAGGQARADFDVTMEPAYKVRGALENFTPGEPAEFEWWEAGSNAAAGGTIGEAVLDGKTGRFALDGVPSGRYTLRVTQGQRARGETVLTVKDGDASGVRVALVPAVTVSGTVHSMGAAPERAGSLPDISLAGVAPCFVSLLAAAPETGVFSRPAGLGQDGAFSIAGVFAGQYRLHVQCRSEYVLSAVSGGADLLSNPEIALEAGVQPAPIEITVKAGGGALRGRVQVSGAPPGTGVLLVPAFTPSAGPVTQLASRMAAPADELGFTFVNLAPGDYVAYAFSGIQSIEYRNPAFLNALRGGTSVRIEDRGTAAVTLRGLVK